MQFARTVDSFIDTKRITNRLSMYGTFSCLSIVPNKECSSSRQHRNAFVRSRTYTIVAKLVHWLHQIIFIVSIVVNSLSIISQFFRRCFFAFQLRLFGGRLS